MQEPKTWVKPFSPKIQKIDPWMISHTVFPINFMPYHYFLHFVFWHVPDIFSAISIIVLRLHRLLSKRRRSCKQGKATTYSGLILLVFFQLNHVKSIIVKLIAQDFEWKMISKNKTDKPVNKKKGKGLSGKNGNVKNVSGKSKGCSMRSRAPDTFKEIRKIAGTARRSGFKNRGI